MRLKKREVPEFRRQEWWRYGRLGEEWRKPKGKDSKMRLQKKGKPPIVKIGYRQPKKVRGLHPCGLREVLIENPRQVEKVNPAAEAIRIASSVGERKRRMILELARERGIRVLNP